MRDVFLCRLTGQQISQEIQLLLSVMLYQERINHRMPVIKMYVADFLFFLTQQYVLRLGIRPVPGHLNQLVLVVLLITMVDQQL